MTGEGLFHKFLLIEDDPAHVMVIRRALRGLVDDLTVCENLESGLEELKKQEFEIIVTDVNLPDNSGIHLVDRIAALAGDAPIIVLTSSASLSDAVEAMKLGARDFIVKNFDEGFREVLALSLSRVYATVAAEAEKRRLQREMEVFRSALENGQDGLALISEEGEIRYANTAFLRFLEKSSGERGKAVEFAEEFVQEAARIQQSFYTRLRELPYGSVWSSEVSLEGERTQAYELSLAVTEVEGRESKRQGVIWVRDISDLKRREQFQREILSTTTHDLKGPLGAILTAAELIMKLTPEEEKSHQLSVRVRSSAQGMLNLINEFLSARQMEEGSFILRPTLVSIQDLLPEIRSNYETIAGARGIDLIFRVEPEDITGNFDKLGFGRVIGNLLSNALKFTPRDGKVETVFSHEGDSLKVSITDTGSGMSPSEVRSIFERFGRLEKHKEIAGSGLGLFVVKSIVEAHGGRVEVLSREGEGTCFELIFPDAPPVNDRGELIALEFD